MVAQGNRINYEEEAIEQHQFDQEKWEKTIEGIDYTDIPKEEKKKEQKERAQPTTAPLDFAGLKYVFIGLGILAMLGLILFLIQNSGALGPKNKKIKPLQASIDLDAIEENLENTDVLSFLQQAIQEGNYTLAIRLYYLDVIKNLSEQKIIKWKRDKTNREYIQELGTHTVTPAFRETTRIFERVWYGDKLLTKEDFQYIQPQFEQLLQKIKTV